MSEKNQDLRACEMEIEDPKEDDSFLEAQIDNEVTYPYEYSPAYASPATPSYTPPTKYQPTRSQKKWREKRREAYPSHVVQYHSQGPLLPLETEHQQQLNPHIQYIVLQETKPTQGGYLDNMTKVQQVTQPVPMVPDYFCISVGICLCCAFLCAWPCGVHAIIASRKATSFAKRGDYVKARSQAKCAMYLIIASVASGILIIGLAIAIIVFLRFYHD